MSKYSVKIGKLQNTIYVQNEQGKVVRYNYVFLHRSEAIAQSRVIRTHLRRGKPLNNNYWTVIR